MCVVLFFHCFPGNEKCGSSVTQHLLESETKVAATFSWLSPRIMSCRVREIAMATNRRNAKSVVCSGRTLTSWTESTLYVTEVPLQQVQHPTPLNVVSSVCLLSSEENHLSCKGSRRRPLCSLSGGSRSMRVVLFFHCFPANGNGSNPVQHLLESETKVATTFPWLSSSIMY